MHKKQTTVADIDTEVSRGNWLTGEMPEEGSAVVAEQDDGLYILSEDEALSF